MDKVQDAVQSLQKAARTEEYDDIRLCVGHLEECCQMDNREALALLVSNLEDASVLVHNSLCSPELVCFGATAFAVILRAAPKTVTAADVLELADYDMNKAVALLKYLLESTESLSMCNLETIKFVEGLFQPCTYTSKLSQVNNCRIKQQSTILSGWLSQAAAAVLRSSLFATISEASRALVPSLRAEFNAVGVEIFRRVLLQSQSFSQAARVRTEAFKKSSYLWTVIMPLLSVAIASPPRDIPQLHTFEVAVDALAAACFDNHAVAMYCITSKLATSLCFCTRSIEAGKTGALSSLLRLLCNCTDANQEHTKETVFEIPRLWKERKWHSGPRESSRPPFLLHLLQMQTQAMRSKDRSKILQNLQSPCNDLVTPLRRGSTFNKAANFLQTAPALHVSLDEIELRFS